MHLDYELACGHGMSKNELDSLAALVERMSISSVSTAYSGIDSPMTAWLQLLAALESEFNLDIGRPKHLFSIEWNEHCQTELRAHPCEAECLFGDIAEFLHPLLRCQLNDLQERNKLTSVLLPVVKDTPEKAIVSLFSCIHVGNCLLIIVYYYIFVYGLQLTISLEPLLETGYAEATLYHS